MRASRTISGGVVALVCALAVAACSLLGTSPPAHPALAPPPEGGEGMDEWRAALAADGKRIVVSLRDRRLWLLQGQDTLFSAPVAIGRDFVFRYGGRSWHFRTPRGERRVLGKEKDPIWVPPDWHYLGKASKRHLEPVQIERGKKYELLDGTHIEVRGDDVGRVNQFGNFWAFTPGMEIIFDGKIFIPPFGTNQRRIPDALGTRKIDLGDGYLIHGVHRYTSDSIGQAASHGCIRMRNTDVERLYEMVDVGMRVYIY